MIQRKENIHASSYKSGSTCISIIDKAADAQIEAIYTLLEAKLEAVQERISLAQYNDEIEASEQEYEAGDYVTQSEFVKEMKQ